MQIRSHKLSRGFAKENKKKLAGARAIVKSLEDLAEQTFFSAARLLRIRSRVPSPSSSFGFSRAAPFVSRNTANNQSGR